MKPPPISNCIGVEGANRKALLLWPLHTSKYFQCNIYNMYTVCSGLCRSHVGLLTVDRQQTLWSVRRAVFLPRAPKV